MRDNHEHDEYDKFLMRRVHDKLGTTVNPGHDMIHMKDINNTIVEFIMDTVCSSIFVSFLKSYIDVFSAWKL